MAAIDWVGFVPAALGISLVPGANQLLGLRNAVRHGAAAAMFAVAGRLAAFAIMIVLVGFGFGFGAVVVQSEQVFAALKWVGVAYLLLLGLQSLWSARRPGSATAAGDGAHSRGVWALGREEFLVAGSNPKAVLLFAALLPQFVSGTGSVTAAIVVAGAGYLVIEALIALVYAAFGARLRRATVARPVSTGCCTWSPACVWSRSPPFSGRADDPSECRAERRPLAPR